MVAHVARDDLGHGEDAAAGREPVAVDRQVQAAPGTTREGDDRGPPVLGVQPLGLETQQGLARALERRAALCVTPCGDDLATGDGEVQHAHGADGDEGPQRVGQEHHDTACHGAQERGAPVAEPEARSVARVADDRLVERGQVQVAVRDHEEHRDDRRDGVQVAEQDAALGDDERDDDRAPRLVVGPIALPEEPEALEHLVLAHCLQDARCAHHAAQRGGERGRKDAHGDQPRRPRNRLHDERVFFELRAIRRTTEDQGDQDVDRPREQDGEECAARDGLRGIAQVARHVRARHDPGGGGEEEGEEQEEVRLIAGAHVEVGGEGLGAEVRQRATEEAHEREHQQGENAVLQSDGPSGADVHADEHAQVDHRGQRSLRETRVRKRRLERLGEAQHVHRHRDGLGQEEHDADGATEARPQAAADQEVGAAPPHARVGGDGRERERREGRDRLRDQHDHDGHEHAAVADDLPEAQEHDHAENGQRARREDAAEGPEACSASALALDGHFYVVT